MDVLQTSRPESSKFLKHVNFIENIVQEDDDCGNENWLGTSIYESCYACDNEISLHRQYLVDYVAG